MNRQLSGFIGTLLQRVPIENLLTREKARKIYYDDLDSNMVKDLMLTYNPLIGEAMMDGMIEEIRQQLDSRPMELLESEQHKLNIFSMTFYYVRDILTFHEGEVVCKYDMLQEWNEFASIIGADLPVTSFLVYEDWENGVDRKNFFWPPVIGHNNGQLNRMLSKGMAENHFHLRGSAPYFDISWINLMNHPTNPVFLGELDRIESDLRDKKRKVQLGQARQNLRFLVQEAALIRLYLSERIEGMTSEGRYRGQKEGEDRTFFIKYYCDCANGTDLLDVVENTLENPDYLEMNASAIQTEIDRIQWKRRYSDYLLSRVSIPMYSKDIEYWILSGERWFLYHMLKKILSCDMSFFRKEYNMFFAYIRIKNELRGELIQNNDINGFDNFQIFQNRKDAFSHVGEWVQSEGMLARMAVRSVLSNPAMKHLELRICPNTTAELIMEDIKGYDFAILKDNNDDYEVVRQLQHMKKGVDCLKCDYGYEQQSLKDRFHYVFHFPKQIDSEKGIISKYECRHFVFRKKILQRTGEIILFRQRYPGYADRLVGIDACSREIGCRPEVFGRAFRTLKYYRLPESEISNTQKHPLRQLRFTYHVGEDFLDITDGLRAIDEAIRFLALNSGDRLGHAMALGTDAVRWYANKGNSVTLALQDFIDNIVWMHHNLIHFGIEGTSSLKGWLEEKYSQYFDYVYQPYISDWREKKGYNAKENIYVDMAWNGFDINTYYLSWLLRGDEPEMYKSGVFKKDYIMDLWRELAINAKLIKKQDIRKIPQVTLLYSMYHYDIDVRNRGSEIKTFRLHSDYPNAVDRIRKNMQVMIDKKGIAIETNPSSNYKISSLDSYGAHPIKELYNIGLELNVSNLESCPQMNVSINTDDIGVFSTTLENEYALLASALEQAVDGNGKPLYKRQNIYRWLDNIREMGLRQSFYYIDGNDERV